jgi:Amt family ammonium transporter
MLGAATGAIAGLAAITPASGTVGPIGALVIGAVSGFVCWWASTSMKRRLGYDDSLDVFGVHGVGGLLGTILLGIFMAPSLGGSGAEDFSMGKQLGVQSLAAVVTAVYSIIVSFVLLKVIGAVIGLRVSQSEENQGMDMSTHGEAAYND